MDIPKPKEREIPNYEPPIHNEKIDIKLRDGVPENAKDIHFSKLEFNDENLVNKLLEKDKPFYFDLKGNDFGLDQLVPKGNMFKLRGIR